MDWIACGMMAVAGMVLVGCRPAGVQRDDLSPNSLSLNDLSPNGLSPNDSPLEPPAARGAATIDKGLIRTVVRSHVAEIRGCYAQGLAADPTLDGRVSVRFTIDPRGTVSEAVVASSSLPPLAEPVAACIAAAVKGWRFPMPPGSAEAEVLYPFVLAPGLTVTSPSGLVEGEQVDGRWFPVEGSSADTAVLEVLDRERRPVAGAKVILALAIGAASEEREAVTDAAGRAVFERLPSGATAIAMIATARTESTAVGSGAVGVIVLIEVAQARSIGNDGR